MIAAVPPVVVVVVGRFRVRDTFLVTLGATVALGIPGCVGYGLYPPPPAGVPEVVTVVLRDLEVAPWPRPVRRGRVVFDIENQGVLAHALVLSGPRAEELFAETIGPGEEEKVAVDLSPGTYRLYCADGDHARRGMSASLVVEEQGSWFRR